jgi:hypothetical protein
MNTYVMTVSSNAVPGREKEYTDWYERVHLKEICALPGVKGGRMLEALPASLGKPAATYLAVFDLETDDPAGVAQEMLRRGKAGEMNLTDCVDPASVQIILFKKIC